MGTQSIGEQPRLNPSIYMLSICFAQLVCWSWISVWLYHTGPLDVVEAVAWAQQFQWGYDRDPYLVALFAKIATVFSTQGVLPLYILSQLCVIATFAAVWRFARYLKLTQYQALLSVIFLLGCVYYHFTTTEFNDNVLQLPLWAWAQYYFYRAMKEQSILTWSGFGILIGLALMAKYSAAILLVAISLPILLTPNGRSSFKSPGIYVGIILAGLIIAPNIQWQIQHDWLYVTYAFKRAEVAPSIWNHIIYPLKFLGAQFLAFLPALLIYGFATRKNSRFQAVPGLLWWIVLGPLVVVLIFSALKGAQIRSMWGMPFLSLLGLLLVFLTQPQLSNTTLRATIFSYGAFWLLSLGIFVGSILLPPYISGNAKLAQFPSQPISQAAEQYWSHYTKKTLRFVAGDRHLTARVAVYNTKHPVPYFDLDPLMSQWINEQQLRQSGALFIWDVERQGTELPQEYRRRFPTLTNPSVKTFQWHTEGNVKPVSVGFAILPSAD